jgi:hypothetical protein
LSKNPITEKQRKNFNEKESYVVIKPKLQTAMTETQTRSRKSLRGVTPDREEDDCLFYKKKFLNRYATDSSTTSVCTRVVQGQGMYAHVQAHYRPRAPLQLLKN